INANGHLLDGATNGPDTSFSFTAGTGGSIVLTPGEHPTFDVGSAADLASAFQAISTGGLFGTTNTDYVINLTAAGSISARVTQPTLGAGDTLTIYVNGHLFNGATTPDLVFAPNGPNGTTVLQNTTLPTTFEVHDGAELAAALQTISLGGFLTSTGATNYIIN